MKLKTKITATGTSKCVIIPSIIIKSLELKLGEELIMDIIDNKIIIEKKIY